MLKKLPSQPQLEMFKTVLDSFINPQHELCLLARKIDWGNLEKEFALLYSEVGRPSIPIRTIVGLQLLKRIYDLGDETRETENTGFNFWLDLPKTYFGSGNIQLYRI